MSRRFAWFAIAILVAVGLYTAGWFYMANRLEEKVAATIAGAGQRGAAADCTRAEARGYPFRIGLFCDGVAYSDPNQGIAVSGTGLRSAAQIYQPSRVVGELDTMSVEIRPVGLEIDLSDIRYSTRLAEPVPKLASVEANDVIVGEIAGERLATARTIQLHMRPRGPDLDLAGSLSHVLLEPATGVAAGLPAFDTQWDATFADAVERLAEPGNSLRGLKGEIRALMARAGAASIAATGTFSVGRSGLLDAELTISVTDPAALLAIVRTAFPELAQQLGQVEVLLTAMGPNPKLPLSISQGSARMGFFNLGRIPPLD